MPEVTNLDEIVPDDLEFIYKKKSYFIPGDIDTTTTFLLQKRLDEIAASELATQKAAAQGGERLTKARNAQERVTLQTEKDLLDLFKQRHPELERLPFGSRGFAIVLGQVLGHLGFALGTEPDPTPTPARKPRARSTRSRP